MINNKDRKESRGGQAIKKLTLLIPVILLLFIASSCIREDEYANNSQGNFNALWTIIDEKYCFLEYKQINWDSIYTVYQKRLTANMSNDDLFNVLGDMLANLKDGHVNLYSAGDQARYWSWYEDYPRNFNESIVENYLGTDYRIAGGAKYKILDDNVGYIYYEAFANAIGNGNLDEIL